MFIEHENPKPFYSFDEHMCLRSNTFAFIDMARIIWDQVQWKENEINSEACGSISLGTLNEVKPGLIDIFASHWKCVANILQCAFCVAANKLTQAIYCAMLIYFNWAVDKHCANRPTYTYTYTWKHSFLLTSRKNWIKHIFSTLLCSSFLFGSRFQTDSVFLVCCCEVFTVQVHIGL